MAPLQAPGFGEKTASRVQACFDYLQDQPQVDGKVAITGFCFGGTYSFSLAVHEPRLKAAVPFYGHSDFSSDDLKKIKCPVLAFYGANDERLIDGLEKLKQDMKSANVNFAAKIYPDCGHAFFNDTNRFAYNEAAAADAWLEANKFLAANISK